MAEQARRPYFWEQHIDKDGTWHRSGSSGAERPSGQDLAALRRGIGREAGSVPELWRFYRTVNRDDLGARGLVSERFAAEHVALSLYGLHQQSQAKPMHKAGQSLGTAMRHLRNSGAFSADAVDRRFNAAATATTPQELALHLRSLITLLRGQQIPVDYTALIDDLARWSWDDSRSRTRRHWGNDYFGWSSSAASDDEPAPPAPTSDPLTPSAQEPR